MTGRIITISLSENELISTRVLQAENSLCVFHGSEPSISLWNWIVCEGNSQILRTLKIDGGPGWDRTDVYSVQGIPVIPSTRHLNPEGELVQLNQVCQNCWISGPEFLESTCVEFR